MTAQQQINLSQEITALGYQDIWQFVHKQLCETTLRKITEYAEKEAFFCQKYQVSHFEEFQTRFHELQAWGIIEKEEDSMEWEITVQKRLYHEQKLQYLETQFYA